MSAGSNQGSDGSGLYTPRGTPAPVLTPPPACACGNCGTVFCGQQNGYLNGVSLTHLIGITVLVISVAVVRPAAVALLLLSGSCCACSAGYGRTAQLLSRVRAQALGCFRACFLNLRFRHLESRRSRGRDVEAGASSAPPTAPVAEASAAPKEPLPLRVLIIHPDDEVVCGMEVAGTDGATARGASADASASNKTEDVAARDGGAVSAAPRAGAAAADAPAAPVPAGSGRHSGSRLSDAEGFRGAAAADGAPVAPASAVRAGPSHSSAPSQAS